MKQRKIATRQLQRLRHRLTTSQKSSRAQRLARRIYLKEDRA